MKIHNIQINAKYEEKLLKRSWLFKIFFILSVLAITFMLLSEYTSIIQPTYFNWHKIALSSFIPFATTYYYNFAQALILVFLSGTFLKRGQKLDTTEVFMVRPMSNTDYILGKVVGISRVFLGLNLIVLAIAIFINVAVSQSSFNIIHFLFYFITISVPTLVFILGLSFMVVNIVKNQAVTFVILLGILGVIIYQLSEKYYGVLDIFGINIPSIFSEINGMADLTAFLLQRSCYLLAGCGLLCLTIVTINRLPEKKSSVIQNLITALLFILAGIVCGWCYVEHFETARSNRIEYVRTYEKYKDCTILSTDANAIEIKLSSNRIDATSKMKIINRCDSTAEKIALYINPGLKVQSITQGSLTKDFIQENQVVVVEDSLQMNDTIEITVKYAGNIDENICYADVDHNTFYQTKTKDIFRYGKHYSYNDNACVLLTPESMWYPTTIPLTNPYAKYGLPRDFIDFSLKIAGIGNKNVISQGNMSQDSVYICFKDSHRLTGLSLLAADYIKREITVDSIEFAVYNFKQNDMLAGQFGHLSDTLPTLIKGMLTDYETKFGIPYPYDKFYILEVPLHFTTYTRSWKGFVESVQPGMVLIPEKGLSINMDLNGMRKIIKNYFYRNKPINDETLETDLFRMSTNFLAASKGYMKYRTTYDLSPCFSTFIRYFHSNEYPIFDAVMTGMQSNSQTDFNPWRPVIGNYQRANSQLNHRSFKRLTKEMGNTDILNELINLKALQLQNYIKSQIGNEACNETINRFLNYKLYDIAELSPLIDSLKIKYDLDISPFLKKWYEEYGCPELLVNGISAYNIQHDDATEYLITFNIKNISDIDAIISASIGIGGGQDSRFRLSMQTASNSQKEDNSRHYIIPAHTAKQCKIISEELPRNLTINYNITNNLPAGSSTMFPKIEEETTDTIEGIFNINDNVFNTDFETGTVIDNTSSGFKLITTTKQSRLKQYLIEKKEEEEYQNFNIWRSPRKWACSVNNNFHGEIIKDAYFKSKGTGKYKAEWNFYNVNPGTYDISIWNFNPQTYRGNNYGEIYYTIKTETWEEEVPIDLRKYQLGWVSLGEFKLPEGDITISLTDKTNAPYVVADAVKYTLVEKNEDESKNKE